MFKTAPVAFSYRCTASLMAMMSSGDVAKMVTSLAYATIAVFPLALLDSYSIKLLVQTVE
jgi:hypothetical protein